jgi:hypothetical protein
MIAPGYLRLWPPAYDSPPGRLGGGPPPESSRNSCVIRICFGIACEWRMKFIRQTSRATPTGGTTSSTRGQVRGLAFCPRFRLCPLDGPVAHPCPPSGRTRCRPSPTVPLGGGEAGQDHGQHFVREFMVSDDDASWSSPDQDRLVVFPKFPCSPRGTASTRLALPWVELGASGLWPPAYDGPPGAPGRRVPLE